MNEVIFYDVDRSNICETNYFDGIIAHLNNHLNEYSIIITADYITLPETKYKKIVFLGGEEGGNAGLRPYAEYPDVVAVFRFYNISGRYDNKYIFPIPPGYNCRSNGTDMVRMYPEKRMEERTIDVFYSGHILNNRKILVLQLEKILPHFNMILQVNPHFRTGMNIDDYYRCLGNTKICVVPDGTSIDTFRFIEACGSGCIILTTPKPNLWYYPSDAPIFFIPNWDCLTKEVIDEILSKDLERLRTRTLEYYKEYLSENAVAEYIIKTICILQDGK
jgi:hypothetical protein